MFVVLWVKIFDYLEQLKNNSLLWSKKYVHFLPSRFKQKQENFVCFFSRKKKKQNANVLYFSKVYKKKTNKLIFCLFVFLAYLRVVGEMVGIKLVTQGIRKNKKMRN
jgi:hypothetical protein